MGSNDIASRSPAGDQDGIKPASHWFLLVTAGFAWGATFSLAKIAAQGDVHPLSLNFSCFSDFKISRSGLTLWCASRIG